MSRVTELEKALTTLFRKGTEVGYTETEIDEFLENIDYGLLVFVVGIAQGGKLGHQVLQIQRNLAVCPIAALVDAILGDVFAFSGVHAEFGNDGKAHILQQPQLHRPGSKHRADIAVAYVLIEKRRSLLEQLRAAIVQAQRIFAVCAVGIDRFGLVPNGLQQGMIYEL